MCLQKSGLCVQMAKKYEERELLNVEKPLVPAIEVQISELEYH